MINFIFERLLKRAGLTPEKLQELVEQTTKEQKEISDIFDMFDQKGQSLKGAYDEYFAQSEEELRNIKENAKRKQAAQDAKVKRAEELDSLLYALRPGMHIRELEEIAKTFGEEYSPEALRNQTNWLGTVKGKCVIDYDADGLLTRIHFFGATDDTRKIARAKRFETVLQTCAGVVHAEDLEVHDRSTLRAVELASNSPDFTILAWFLGGHFHSTTYQTPAERERMAAGVIASKPPAPAKPTAPPTKTPEQMAADTELRKVYYAWADQNEDETYRDLVEWIISQTSPDARHYQLGFNWDHGCHIPFWIIRQPDTCLATALKAFELGQAHYWLAQPKTDDPGSRFAYELNERIRDGFYATPSKDDKAIAYTPSLDLDRYPPEKADALRKIVAPQVFEPLSGRGEHLIYCDIPEKFIDYLT
jgi:ferritin